VTGSGVEVMLHIEGLENDSQPCCAISTGAVNARLLELKRVLLLKLKHPTRTVLCRIPDRD
jgi:hypothetical protein